MSRIIIFGGLPQGLSFLFLLCLFLPFSFGYPRQMFVSLELTVLKQQYSSCAAFSSELEHFSQERPITWRRQGKLQGLESSRCHQISKIPLSWAKLPVSWTRDFRGAASVHPHQEEVIFSMRVTYDPVVATSTHWPTNLDRTGMAPLLLMPQEKSQCSLQFEWILHVFYFTNF